MYIASSQSAETLMSMRPLDETELDAVSGGFIWILPVVGGFALGTAIRWGISKLF